MINGGLTRKADTKHVLIRSRVICGRAYFLWKFYIDSRGPQLECIFERLIGFYTGFHEFTGFCKVVDEGSSALAVQVPKQWGPRSRSTWL